MKTIFLFTFSFLILINIKLISQEVINKKYDNTEHDYFSPKNHDANINNYDRISYKSFYDSRSDWQHIIDSTWGGGDPLPQKLLIFNTYAQKVHDEFDGFLSLQLNWDSLYNHYLNKITDSTSRGAFSSIMSHFAYDLRDLHTRAFDSTVVFTPLNPGIPILLMGSYISVEHFGAVTTILPDSTTLVLRVIPNHPLNIEPGDVILGYEGIPWKNLLVELLNAGLPMVAYTGGCNTTNTYLNLFGAGVNWHLFNTIDILKYSTGDTVHLSVLPLLGLNIPVMFNNEQMAITNIPFPNILANDCATYGILDNTNIGFIYLAQESPEATADAQLLQAVNSLSNTDGLIIDMRLNFGGWALFDNAFKKLFNNFYSTIEDAYRCNASSFELCPSGDGYLFEINGMAPEYFNKPIAVLLGPTCISMGDITAHRLKYQQMVKFFGKSSSTTLGDNLFIHNFSGWYLRYSISDMFYISNPENYLNRNEFPIDFDIWHNPDDVAIYKDAVVDKALDWINNLVYPHDVSSNKTYYSPGLDSLYLSTLIENPNSHQLVARAYIETKNGLLIDSVEFVQQINGNTGEQWNATLPPINDEEIFVVSVSVFDGTVSTSFQVKNTTRYTTSGPVVLDSIPYTKSNGLYYCRPYITNKGEIPLSNVTGKLICNDAWVTHINPPTWELQNLPPNLSTPSSGTLIVSVNDSLFQPHFNFSVTLGCANWPYWADSQLVIVGVENDIAAPLKYGLQQNYPNPFNASTNISWQSPVSGWQSLMVFDVLGREVAVLVNEYRFAGKYKIDFNASVLPSGVYFYQLAAGNYIAVKKMVLLK